MRIYGRKLSANCMWPGSRGKLDYKLILNAKSTERQMTTIASWVGHARFSPSEDEIDDFIGDEMDDFIGVKASTNP